MEANDVYECGSCLNSIVVDEHTHTCPCCGVEVRRCIRCGTVTTDPHQLRCASCSAWLDAHGKPNQANKPDQKKGSIVVGLLWVLAVWFVLFWIFGGNETTTSSSDNLPIVDGPFKDCLIRNGYAPAYDLDQLAVNGRAIDICE